MPFAVVEGQPITEMPRDLYIPPQALEVFLEAFEGPLDMLLYLIRRQNLDILDIPIAEITRQYMRYIELMQVLQLELAGEYLLMAATLAEVKSRMLLPRVGNDECGGRGGSARGTGAPPAGIRALQARGRGHRSHAAAGARYLGGIGGFGGPQGRAHSAAGDAAGNAAGLSRRAVAQRHVRAPPRAARAVVGAAAHDRRAVVAARRTPSSISCSLFRADEGRRGVTVTFVADPGTVARGIDRNSAGGSLCAAARTPRQSGPAPDTGGRRRRRQR